VIPRNHHHHFQPVARRELPNGGWVIVRKCVCADDPDEAIFKALEEHRQCGPDGAVVDVRYRFAGIWIEPLDLLRIRDVPLEECPQCEGRTLSIPGVTCDTCNGTGLTENGEALRMPELKIGRD
jgi:hypothetical protein